MSPLGSCMAPCVCACSTCMHACMLHCMLASLSLDAPKMKFFLQGSDEMFDQLQKEIEKMKTCLAFHAKGVKDTKIRFEAMFPTMAGAGA